MPCAVTARVRLPGAVAPLTCKTSERAGAVVLALEGDLDLRGTTVLDPEIERASADPRGRIVVLDLRNLRFVDSSGLRSILLAQAALSRAGRRLALVRGSAAVQRVFAVTRMDEHLAFADTVEAATARADGGPAG